LIDIPGRSESSPVAKDRTRRVALVTGSARGIGLATANRLAADGHHVVLADLDGADEAAAEIAERHGSAEGHACDLGEFDQVEELARLILDEHGGCDVLVNNVAHGGGRRRSLAEHDRALWTKTFAVNLQAAVQLTTVFLPGMTERRFGRIVNVLSNTLWSPPRIGILAYVSSKGALLGFTRALAKEVGPAGITVNGVAPGLVLSRPQDNVPHDEAFYREVAEAQSIPRTLVPEDLAGAVSFLASDDAAMVTGQTLCVDGGTVML
jgi:NAD(P)-dependent dehydrogenase (short-subunit alcohol dehydrogenase family)